MATTDKKTSDEREFAKACIMGYLGERLAHETDREKAARISATIRELEGR